MAQYNEECNKLRQQLLDCVLQSRCYRIENKTPRECINRGGNMPEECKSHHIDLVYCRTPHLKKTVEEKHRNLNETFINR
ncbi:hypothetical protein DPMN_108241 [Dreissena polymorpha]|uniref:Cytochrome c oxidase assembly factor 5 n=1 Tax=Dreissena polymorpha TaxID=45954 RepID=A0A9D4K884_DREPO|nr:hypothetical protein DPMN_108241 [Dreissena polymorpha]